MNEKLAFSTDAKEWANEFVQMFGGDPDLMATWFSSAIETGRGAGILQGAAMVREQVGVAVDEMDALDDKYAVKCDEFSKGRSDGFACSVQILRDHTGIAPSKD